MSRAIEALPIDRDARVRDLVPLVKRIAYHFMTRLPPSVQVDDLIQAGLIGLLDAVDHFDDSMGAQFETYATQRVRGAILDELRQLDWLPRQARKNLRQIEAAVAQLEQRLGRAPLEQELAGHLNVPLAEYQQMLSDARGTQLLYFEDFGSDDDSGDFLDFYATPDGETPLGIMEDYDFRKVLAAGIDALPEREKMVMALHYNEELNLKEIGAVLGVTESRVCQLHSQAVARLRAKLRDWVGERAQAAETAGEGAKRRGRPRKNVSSNS